MATIEDRTTEEQTNKLADIADAYAAITRQHEEARAALRDADGRPLLRDDLHEAREAEINAQRAAARASVDAALRDAAVQVSTAVADLPAQPYSHLSTNDLARLDALRKTLRADMPPTGDERAEERFLSDAVNSKDPVYRMAAAAASRDWNARRMPLKISEEWQRLQDIAASDRINPDVRDERARLLRQKKVLDMATRYAREDMPPAQLAQMLADYAAMG